jgi:hypothetical protein
MSLHRDAKVWLAIVAVLFLGALAVMFAMSTEPRCQQGMKARWVQYTGWICVGEPLP